MNRRKLIKQAAASLIIVRLTPLALPGKTVFISVPSSMQKSTTTWDNSNSSPLDDLRIAAELIRNQPFNPEYARARQKVWSSIWP